MTSRLPVQLCRSYKEAHLLTADKLRTNAARYAQLDAVRQSLILQAEQADTVAAQFGRILAALEAEPDPAVTRHADGSVTVATEPESACRWGGPSSAACWQMTACGCKVVPESVSDAHGMFLEDAMRPRAPVCQIPACGCIGDEAHP